MDYKEKYEMALEGIQEILGSGEDSIKMSRLQLRLQGIFPELAESGDERIRKVLVELVKCNERCGYFMINNITTSAMLAWLEKQGEQKPVPDWMPKFLDELRSKKNYFGWDEHKDIEGGILAIINWMNPNYFNGKEGEQNTAWSEEDKRLRTSCIKHIEEELERIRNDKYGHSEIISDLKESCRERINWLESLRPQSHWKPSDEQIYSLDRALRFYGKGSAVYDSVKELLEQLKKLK